MHKLSAKSRPWVTIGTILISICIVAILGFIAFGKYTVVLTQAQIQEKINAKLPFLTKGDITVQSAELTINAEDIEGVMVMSGTKFSKAYTLTVYAKGVPEYHTSTESFHLKPEKVEVKDFKYEGPKASQVLKLIAERYLDKQGTKNLLNDASEKIDGLIKKLAEDAAVAYLKRMPVYRLKDSFKHIMIGAALESMTVKDGTITATVSAWQLTKSILAFLFVAALLLIGFVAMVLNPGMIFESPSIGNIARAVAYSALDAN